MKDLVRKHKVQVLLIQESKLSSMSDSIARELWGSRFTKWVAVDSVGHAGGIIMLWDARRVQVTNSWGGRFSSSAIFKDEEIGFQWMLSGVYGPCQHSKMGEIFAELNDIRERWDGPWCLGGDSNLIS